MADTYKTYFQRNLKKVIAKFGDVALLDEIAKSNLAQSLQNEIDGKASSSDLSTLSGKVTTLVGSDTNKSVRSIANEELAAQLIPENAKESLDTLSEIAAWIQSHPDDASAMNDAIAALQRKAALGTYIPEGETEAREYATVKAYVEAEVAKLMTAINGTTKKDDFSAETTGTGNVVTAISYDATTGKTTATKGATAILDSDLVDLTDAEIDALFAND